MKKRVTTVIAWALIIVMFILITPSLITRLEAEKANKNVNIAVLYNDLAKKVSSEKLDENLNEYKKIGVDTIAVMEEDLNAYVAAGKVTCIKYNVLLHKYDEESVYVGDVIAEKYPNVTLDSYVVLVKRDEMQEKLRYLLPRRFADDDYTYIGNVKYDEATEDMDIYLFHNGHNQLWDFALGYDEDTIEALYEKGFKIALIHKVKNYEKTEYLEDIDRIVKKYKVEFLNLKEDTSPILTREENDKNYKGIADIINNNNMTLVVTENSNQLSNQRFLGYSYVFDSVVKNNGVGKVIRAYETYDDSQVDETVYGHRTTQFFNSTMDRNLRFITVTQLNVEKFSMNQLADYTLLATAEYKEKIENEGFSVNGNTSYIGNYSNKTFNYACCAVIMVMAVLIMIKLIGGKEYVKLSIASFAVCILGFAATILLPVRFSSLLTLYPTVYCVVQSCFAMTLLLCFLKAFKERLGVFTLTLSGVAIMLSSLLMFSIGMGSMLSGIDYYINNSIFRGIKLSLIVPIVFTAVVFYVLFMQNKKGNLLNDIYRILNADIKVFWVLIGGFVLAVGAYYIIRSGNVESISVFEKKMRTALTELFSARPRTKEFLIGYPATVLLVYYLKKTDIKLIQWLLAIASSILAASVTNSFCHVFTDYSVIVSRTVNGFIVGVLVCIVVIIANLLLVKAAKNVYSKIKSNPENE
ncbi:MAG: hypothetical protein IJW06_06325 [Clostridia bacterium]|nr:hypothetical protein [Clostridia bacterium]